MEQFFNPQDLIAFGSEFFVIGLAFVLFVVDMVLPSDWRRTVPVLALLGLAFAIASVFLLDIGAGAGDYFSPDARTGSYTGFAGLLSVDAYAQFFKLVFLVACFIAVLASMRFLEDEGVTSREFYPLLLISTAGAMFMVGAKELLTLWVALETMVLPIYVLAGYFKRDRRSNEAAFKYFVLAAFSSAVFVYGTSLIYGLTGTTFLSEIAKALASGETLANAGPFFVLALVLLAAALAFEVTLVPFHAWAPDTYEGAPTPVTAFLAVGPKIAAVAVMARIFVEAFGAHAAVWQGLFAVLAALTMTVGNVTAVLQKSAKRMLAYSSIAHAGYLMLGFVAADRFGLASVLFYSFVYLFMNMGAFYMLLLLRRDGAACENVEDFSGLAQSAPVYALMMLIFLLSLTGIPVTAGFVGKFFLFGAAIKQGFLWLVVVAALNTVVSLYYYMRIVLAMYFKEPDDEVEISASPSLRLALALTLAGTLIVGLYPGPLWNFSLNCATLFLR